MRHHRLDTAITDYLLTKPSQRSDDGLRSGLGQFCDCMQGAHALDFTVEGIGQNDLESFKLGLETRALSPSTINTRMTQVWSFLKWAGDKWQSVALSTAKLKLPLVNRPKQRRKWAMTDAEAKWAAEFISTQQGLMWSVFADYLDFTIETGFRTEEVLRLVEGDFKSLEVGEAGCWVPGTKTEGSNVYVPITDLAAEVIERRSAVARNHHKGPHVRLFDIPYHTLRRMWEEVRAHLGLADNPTATLKGLRRTFAYRCLRKGLPPRLLQELMRHSSYSTTLEYLELFGLADNPETRALMNKQLGQPAKAGSRT